ncbi:PIN/TRAM domain-containing protein [Levilactobacillus zymae]|jgi:Integral membrane protein (PIN domain superfamily)|uniref:Membrane-associated protein containing RNA-binding TRAM domain and ribonuclease PIN-domain, YacL B.subtilis ortholog n=1 Tax=Levilactobacillus zymae TaxID=267363 RepID=A0A1Y6JXR2_9LACO|nr:PIN/TRAM domain-containing protein [Levilactobacillus zymae]KRL12190.1 integral membrane protein [Levilactobacillus zymae DSM 19395]QFR61334.1 PIN domain nuclease [Levilactobacillus zymae]GEO72536.1 twitching motility protein PilT [Levilactobacillus zymae]SMS13653.1 Membrane-associated protein containing RNA-binding TRAM domain and ribonuclease PIN-domain, YacL B.subtilis ortholog [Levilactobacillus zymae]
MKNRKRTVILALFIIIGGVLGAAYLPRTWQLFGVTSPFVDNILVNILLGAIIFLILGAFFASSLVRVVNRLEAYLNRQNPMTLIFGSLLTIVGLALALLISQFLFRVPSFFISTVIPWILMLLLGYLGFRLGTRLSKIRGEEWRKLFQSRTKKANDEASEKVLDKQAEPNFHHYKILDTNILIDGRIYDLAKTGFLEGTLLVPNFVLYELQYIADSSDSVKRVRGRRGLDILNKLQNEQIMPIEMYEGDFEDIPEVDSKLIALAKKNGGVIVTNDYNLNKVIQFQNVQVLNINSLANALKPRVIPGENLHVMVVKNGTERQQGVAYLDDGTMVVVEDGKYFINKQLDVVVTSAIQTDAGRMIFAKPVHSDRGIEDHKTQGKRHNGGKAN